MKKATALLIFVSKKKSFLLKACGVGLLAGIIIVFSTPNEYETSIFTVPESTTAEIAADAELSPLGALGATNSTQMVDAIRPTRYSLVIHSVPFLTSLFDIPVTLSATKEPTTITLYEYMAKYQQRPWWNYVTSFPRLAIGLIVNLFQKERMLEEAYSPDKPLNILHLTRRQAAIAGAINRRISVDVDKTRRTITLHVRMQDPLVAATVADSISSRLQAYVRKYRIEKENYNITYLEEVHSQAQEAYHQAQKVYAHFVDRNHDLATQSARKELTNLRIEKDLAYSHFVKTRRQLQAARNRVVMERPVYAVIEPATVPVKPVGRWWMVVGCVVVAVVIGGGWGWMQLKIQCRN